MHDVVDEIEVNGRGLSWGLGMGLVWALVTGALWSQGPGWAGQAMLALAPLVMVASLWSALTRRVLIVSSQGLRLTTRPIALWDIARIPREHLAFVALDERETDPEDRPFWGQPRTTWAVVAHTRGGSQVTVADGYADSQGARALADRIRRVTGC